ncbi:hypothetical protein MLD52_07175 [Puniceicoccaceae bacterium K14]|nr:hypothetical protein [Puniceicoccaceae bacterium K14]
MDHTIANALDLRSLDVETAKTKVAERASQTKIHNSFWALCDHDPIELYETFIDLGLNIQAFVYPPEGYRIFLGR